MTRILVKVIVEHYKTFTDAIDGRAERHASRLMAQILLGICGTMFFEPLSDNAINAMITALSILAGFSFSAMFPIASDAKKDLPKPHYPEDIDDFNRLSKLSSAFRANVSYFIPLTLLCIGTLIVQMLRPSEAIIIKEVAAYVSKRDPNIYSIIFSVIAAAPRIVLFISIFLFAEALYTFYRMCFTVAFTLRIREEYREGRR